MVHTPLEQKGTRMGTAHSQREMLKAGLWKNRSGVVTDQQKGIPHPPPEKPFPEAVPMIDLVAPERFAVGAAPLLDTINRRRSRREFTSEPLSFEALSFLLWTTQGVREVAHAGLAVFRTVPSAGARHAIETYLIVNRVDGLEPGLYRYASMTHQVCHLEAAPPLAARAARACHMQMFVAECAVVFVWTAIPYRMEWRYGPTSPKLIALDAGHVCQNLYLAAESVGAGACAIAAYDQDGMDALVGVDGEDEFVIYLAPVGKIR